VVIRIAPGQGVRYAGLEVPAAVLCIEGETSIKRVCRALAHIDLTEGRNRARPRRRANRYAIDWAPRRILNDWRGQVVVLVALQVDGIDVVELSADGQRPAQLYFTSETGLIGSRVLVVGCDSSGACADEWIGGRPETKRRSLLDRAKRDDGQLVQGDFVQINASAEELLIDRPACSVVQEKPDVIGRVPEVANRIRINQQRR